MSTYLNRFDAEEEMAYQHEDLTSRATALVKMGLVNREGSGFTVERLGFGRGNYTVSGDYLYCTCGQSPCLHRLAAKLFVQEPEKKPTPARREDDPQGPNVAASMRELLSPRQLVAIRIKAAARGLSAEAESLRLMQCPPERLTRAAASRLIDYLDSQEVDRGRRIA